MRLATFRPVCPYSLFEDVHNSVSAGPRYVLFLQLNFLNIYVDEF
jgi:hypothetical protein